MALDIMRGEGWPTVRCTIISYLEICVLSVIMLYQEMVSVRLYL